MGDVTAKLNDDGSTSLTLNFGGVATEVLVVNVLDAEIIVRNAAGEVYSRCVRENELRPWWRVPSVPPTPPKEVITVAWVKLFEEDATSNAFGSYVGPEGRAQVWRAWDNLVGFVNGKKFTVARPPEGNVQWLQIFPDVDGWYVHSLVDPRDNRRALWRERVAPR